MLSIFATTEYIPEIRAIVQSEHRLEELVDIFDITKKEPTPTSSSLVIDRRGIAQCLDWINERPPYLFQTPLPFKKNILLGLTFCLLENYEKAGTYIGDEMVLISDMNFRIGLQYNYPINLSTWMMVPIETDYDNYKHCHNWAVVNHYGDIKGGVRYYELVNSYQKALEAAFDDEYYAFTARHFATLLLDSQDLKSAEELLISTLEKEISEDAEYSLKALLTKLWMSQLTVPYNETLLEQLKTTLWETVQFFEQNDRRIETGLQYLDAAYIANISESFAEALAYTNKAIHFFEAEQVEELLGKAQLQKGMLLSTWSQQGNPQFYKPAVQAYQQALKVFRQDIAPDVFADIHHNLGVLYAEMPAENKKRSIWAGVSTSSFQEALNYFTKEKHPYEYGKICNNYGNALTKFPLAIHSDNYQKALFYYQEALDVRTPKYPHERAITLLNFLEASWNASNSLKKFNERRYKDMVEKANEVLKLVSQPDMLVEAQKHLDLLEELRTTVTETS